MEISKTLNRRKEGLIERGDYKEGDQLQNFNNGEFIKIKRCIYVI